MREPIPDHGVCFGCGDSNPDGLGVRFYREPDRSIWATFTPALAQQGARGISHGGAVFSILDEAMGKAVWSAGHPGLTTRVAIRYRKPARLGEELTIRGWFTEVDDRGTIHAQADARRPDGVVVAETTGEFRPAPAVLGQRSKR